MDTPKDNLDKLFQSFTKSLDIVDDNPLRVRAGITIWLPAEYKQKYIDLQGRSHRKLSKLLREIVVQCIDRVEADPSL